MTFSTFVGVGRSRATRSPHWPMSWRSRGHRSPPNSGYFGSGRGGRRDMRRRSSGCRMVTQVHDRRCGNERQYETRQDDGDREDPASPALFVLLMGPGPPGRRRDRAPRGRFSPSCSHDAASPETAAPASDGRIGRIGPAPLTRPSPPFRRCVPPRVPTPPPARARRQLRLPRSPRSGRRLRAPTSGAFPPLRRHPARTPTLPLPPAPAPLRARARTRSLGPRTPAAVQLGLRRDRNSSASGPDSVGVSVSVAWTGTDSNAGSLSASGSGSSTERRTVSTIRS